MKTIENDLVKILKETFPTAQLSNDYQSLKVDDFPEWDSLGTFNLLLAVEEFYNIRFSVEEMSQLKSTDHIVLSIYNKIQNHNL